MNPDAWKSRLYTAYVSSGQARFKNVNRDLLFSARAPWLRRIISLHVPAAQKTSSVLDLGCGHGPLVHFLRESGFESVIGVDVSAEQIQAGEQLGISGLVHSDLATHMSRTSDASVGVVFLLDVLEHLTCHELFLTMDEVFRVLSPGGRCIIHVPNAEGIFGMRIRYGDLTHEQSFTTSSMNQLLATIGFEKVNCFEDKPIAHGVKSMIRRLIWDIGTIPFRLLLTAETGAAGSILSSNMLVVAQK